jgi:glycerol uptake facilitator-like aquaporin
VTALARRLAAEFTGTGLLVAVVVGSGIAATRLTGDGAVRLLVNSTVTALGLAVLILLFAPAGGAQFNPVVTAADWLLARNTPDRYGAGHALAVMASQVAGAIGGAALADAMFAAPVLSPSGHHRGGGPVLLSEVVATAGLLLLIVSLARTGRTQHACWSVGAWIGAAYWFTASTAFANPAVTIGRTLTNTYAGIAPASAPGFIAAQLLGGLLGLALAVTIYPAAATPPHIENEEPAALTGRLP